jgi:hypothetical protein
MQPIIAREASGMVDKTDAQIDAALSAAKARQAIAERIRKLVPGIQKDADAQIVLHLAEAYANLAAEPPRVRAPEIRSVSQLSSDHYEARPAKRTPKPPSWIAVSSDLTDDEAADAYSRELVSADPPLATALAGRHLEISRVYAQRHRRRG